MIQHILSNIRDSYGELTRTGPAWLEVAFSSMAICSGLWVGWPFFHEYNSQSAIFRALTEDLPPWLWGALFSGAGLFQLLSFFVLRRRDARLWASSISAGLWAMVAWILFADRAPGWATAVTPLLCVFQLVSFVILCGRLPRRGYDISAV